MRTRSSTKMHDWVTGSHHTRSMSSFILFSLLLKSVGGIPTHSTIRRCYQRGCFNSLSRFRTLSLSPSLPFHFPTLVWEWEISICFSSFVGNKKILPFNENAENCVCLLEKHLLRNQNISQKNGVLALLIPGKKLRNYFYTKNPIIISWLDMIKKWCWRIAINDAAVIFKDNFYMHRLVATSALNFALLVRR